MINWGMEEGKDDVGMAEEPSGVVADWVFRKKTDPATKDWLFQPTVGKTWTKNLRQSTMNVQRMSSFQTAGNADLPTPPPPDQVLTDGWKSGE